MAEPLRKYEPSRPDLRAVDVGPTRRVTDAQQSLLSTPIFQAYRVLRFAFTIAPLIAGLDKYFHFLVNWDQYLTPIIPNVFGVNAHDFMLAVGAIEIVVGIGVALKPKIFAYIVSLWLVGITINLISMGQFYDIALRDIGLALCAFALGRLAQVFDRNRFTRSGKVWR
jgi:hypothetical protein